MHNTSLITPLSQSVYNVGTYSHIIDRHNKKKLSPKGSSQNVTLLFMSMGSKNKVLSHIERF